MQPRTARLDNEAQEWDPGEVQGSKQWEVAPPGAAFTELQKAGGALRDIKNKSYHVNTRVSQTPTSTETRKHEIATQFEIQRKVHFL